MSDKEEDKIIFNKKNIKMVLPFEIANVSCHYLQYSNIGLVVSSLTER